MKRNGFSLWMVLPMILLYGLEAMASAQTAIAAPPLDVLSVKQDDSGQKGGSISLRSDGIYAQHAPFRFLVISAYNHEFAEDHIVNMPAWAGDQFDVAGKVASADLPKLKDLPREPYTAMRSQLLQQVLVERFQLKAHTEIRQGRVYALVIAKGGAKIRPSGDHPAEEYVAPDGQHVQMGTVATSGRVAGHTVPLAMLVRSLMAAGELDRVVVDRTGLGGNFDYELTWTPDLEKNAEGQDGKEKILPPLFTAIQEQLGLKLEPATGPINTLVIDHVEKPSSN